MSKYIIFHNPRCSKSRQTLQILKDNDCNTEIILYLETAIDQSVLKSVIKKISLLPFITIGLSINFGCLTINSIISWSERFLFFKSLSLNSCSPFLKSSLGDKDIFFITPSRTDWSKRVSR